MYFQQKFRYTVLSISILSINPTLRHLDQLVLQFEGVAQFLKLKGWDAKDVWLGESGSGIVKFKKFVLIFFKPNKVLSLAD
jgi:hypothetical protein